MLFGWLRNWPVAYPVGRFTVALFGVAFELFRLFFQLSRICMTVASGCVAVAGAYSLSAATWLFYRLRGPQ